MGGTGPCGWVGRLCQPNARGLRRGLPGFLRGLERAGIQEFRGARGNPGFDVEGRRLGVVRATQSDTDFPGSIYVTLDLPSEQVGGYVAANGDALAEWLPIFLRDDERADLRDTLARSGAAERHAFVVVSGLSGAPFSVTDLLIRDDAPLPRSAPPLPAEVTDVWAVSTWASGTGFWWSSGAHRWQKFTKRG